MQYLHDRKLQDEQGCGFTFERDRRHSDDSHNTHAGGDGGDEQRHLDAAAAEAMWKLSSPLPSAWGSLRQGSTGAAGEDSSTSAAWEKERMWRSGAASQGAGGSRAEIRRQHRELEKSKLVHLERTREREHEWERARERQWEKRQEWDDVARSMSREYEAAQAALRASGSVASSLEPHARARRGLSPSRPHQHLALWKSQSEDVGDASCARAVGSTAMGYQVWLASLLLLELLVLTVQKARGALDATLALTFVRDASSKFTKAFWRRRAQQAGRLPLQDSRHSTAIDLNATDHWNCELKAAKLTAP